MLYKVQGKARDVEWILDNQEMVVSYAKDEMRNHNMIPILDKEVDLSYSYDAKTETFDFELKLPAVKNKKPHKWLGYLAQEHLLVGDEVKLVG